MAGGELRLVQNVREKKSATYLRMGPLRVCTPLHKSKSNRESLVVGETRCKEGTAILSVGSAEVDHLEF